MVENLTNVTFVKFKGTILGWLCNTQILKKQKQDFPGGPVVKNLPSNTGEVGSIPDQGTKIPCAPTKI